MITIFTPTYNREKLLKRCYESLEKQSDKNFKWLVIDDGSKDDTKKMIEKIKEKATFEIKYIYQKNGGKHRAHNKAVDICDTNYFLILDSDDVLDSKCIEILNGKIKEIDKNGNVSGVLGNRFYYNNKKCIGTPIPNLKYSTGLELYQKYNFNGDTLRLYKTCILKKNLFPEIEGEKFVYENVVWDKIDTEYKMLLIKDKLYYCEYQEDGYTNRSEQLKINNPVGYSLFLKSASETAVSLNKKINWTLLYIIWCRHMKINGLKNYKNRILYVLLYPCSLVLEIVKLPKFFFKLFELNRGEKNE